MDNSEFLSFFWGLSDEKSNAQIVQSAESIVNLVETKQKFENRGKEPNKEKFKLYLNICENASEDILYTFKRLIGGISSTGINARRGFMLTFALMTEKFSNILNFNELISIIEKETLISKSEKGHIKNCALTGKILMLKTLLEIKTLHSETILTIFKILLDSITIKFTEEAILQTLSEFLNKLKENFYYEISEAKKTNRFLDKFLNLINKILVNKSNFLNMKFLYEFSLSFILLSYSDLGTSIGNFFPTSVLTNLLTESSLLNYFKLLLAHNIRDNEFHVSFKLLNNLLIKIGDLKKIIEVWNVLIDPSVQKELKIISQKNNEYLIYNLAKFLIENYFILEYTKQIFDSSFFDTLLKFSSNKKFKYIGSLVEALVKQMKNLGELNEKQNELKSDYAKDLLQIFGEGLLSPQSYKSFFIFLFNSLNDELKTGYIEKMTKNFDEESEEEGLEEDLMFRISALRQLMVSGETEISKKLKNEILKFFFREFYNQEMTGDVEMENILEDRLMIIIFAYLRIPKEEIGGEEESVKTVKDTKIIKNLLSIHKLLQGLITSNEIEDFDMEDYKVYTKHLKKLTTFYETHKLTETSDKEKSEKLASVIKLGLVSLILFLKSPNEYSDVITDLLEVTQFKKDWQKVYMDLLISLLHKGNNTLSEFVMNCFKKIAKYFNIDGLNVVVDFLSQGAEKEDIVMESEEEEEVDNTSHKKINGNGVDMFDDLVENGETDEISI